VNVLPPRLTDCAGILGRRADAGVPLPPDAGNFRSLVTAGLTTLACGCRIITGGGAQKKKGLLRPWRPVGGPQREPSGRISPRRTAASCHAGLGGRSAALSWAVPAVSALNRRLLNVTAIPVLLRAGGVAAEALEAALGQTFLNPPKRHCRDHHTRRGVGSHLMRRRGTCDWMRPMRVRRS